MMQMTIYPFLNDKFAFVTPKTMYKHVSHLHIWFSE